MDNFQLLSPSAAGYCLIAIAFVLVAFKDFL
jgi:hypothetical protein